MARKHRKKTQTKLLTRVFNALVLICVLVAIPFTVYLYYLKTRIGTPVAGEPTMTIIVDPDYGNEYTADLCHEPTCLSKGSYSVKHRIPHNTDQRIILRQIEERYFLNLPPVVWYFTKYDNLYGWVPRHFTDKKLPFSRSFTVNNKGRVRTRMCPTPECSIGDEIGFIPDNTRLLATRVVYKHYRTVERADAWLYVHYNNTPAWINIKETSLYIPGPHYSKAPWQS